MAAPAEYKALRYNCGVHAVPATPRHRTRVRAGQSAVAVWAMSAAPSAVENRTLAIALSHAASPGRTLAPLLVSGASSAGAYHAAAAA
jgi:hypothetical protein